MISKSYPLIVNRVSNNCIKMGERVSQQRSPENPQTTPLVFFIKIRSKLHGILSRRNTASHRCCFLQGLRRSPSAFPFYGQFFISSEKLVYRFLFIFILLFQSLSLFLSHSHKSSVRSSHRHLPHLFFALHPHSHC